MQRSAHAQIRRGLGRKGQQENKTAQHEGTHFVHHDISPVAVRSSYLFALIGKSAKISPGDVPVRLTWESCCTTMEGAWPVNSVRRFPCPFHAVKNRRRGPVRLNAFHQEPMMNRTFLLSITACFGLVSGCAMGAFD